MGDFTAQDEPICSFSLIAAGSQQALQLIFA
jgi:hypothetical protein